MYQLIAQNRDIFLTIKTYKGWKIGKKSHPQTQFLSDIWADILPSICSIFIARVTLVTAKNQHRCWKARAYTRVRKMPNFHRSFSCLSQRIIPNEQQSKLFDNWDYHFAPTSKFFRHFSAIFSLFGAISPHIHIGGKTQNEEIHCKHDVFNSNRQAIQKSSKHNRTCCNVNERI